MQHVLSSSSNLFDYIGAILMGFLLYILALFLTIVIDELLTQAKRTKIFTILPKTKSQHTNQLYLHVELVQDTRSILVLIEYNYDYERNSRYHHQLVLFFSILFDSSKTIQTWGDCKEQLDIGASFLLFTHGELSKIQFLNLQQNFKHWYNDTFPHKIQCPQYLKYNTSDSKSCSCSHRPYKSKSSQWSLLQALLYTFNENLTTSMFDIQKCLAITKLGHIVRENWSIEQLNKYKINRYIYHE
ncbi:unnamed protein product [Rotaria socialis]